MAVMGKEMGFVELKGERRGERPEDALDSLTTIVHSLTSHHTVPEHGSGFKGITGILFWVI